MNRGISPCLSHKSMQEELPRLTGLEEKARLMGGADKLDQQGKTGKMTARERIEYILDTEVRDG